MVDDLTEEPLILLHREASAQALRGLLAGLLQWKGRGDWDLIHLRWMRRTSDSDLKSLWRQMPHRLPFLLTHSRRQEGQTRTLPNDLGALRRSLSRSMRDNIPYYPRLLTRDEHDWSVRFARRPEEIAPHCPHSHCPAQRTRSKRTWPCPCQPYAQ